MSEIQGIQGVGASLPKMLEAGSALGAGKQPERSFQETLVDMLGEVDRLQKDSGQAIEGFAQGEVEDVHSVMEAMTKADLSFRMLLEVRNKLVDAYQEVMRTRV